MLPRRRQIDETTIDRQPTTRRRWGDTTVYKYKQYETKFRLLAQDTPSQGRP
jgi:hypothetical protein